MNQTKDSGGADRVHRVRDVWNLADDTFVIRIDRHGLDIKPGQHVTLGITGEGVNREYSLYAYTEDDALDFLIKVHKGGYVSSALQKCAPGTPIDCSGPFGAFVINDPQDTKQPYLFIATGVGIVPFHCFVQSFPDLNYHILHGVSRLADRYDMHKYERKRYVSCVSMEEGGDYRGRVTSYLEENPVAPSWKCYLCGNNAMVSEVYDLLRKQGLSSDNLKTEVFY